MALKGAWRWTTAAMLSNKCLHKFPLARSGLVSSVFRRGLLTQLHEPALDAPALERPCTLILSEDEGFYDASWFPTFSESLVSQFGMSHAQFSLSPSSTNMDAALQELSRDVSPLPQVVLVTRGPWMSWMAQFYLESLSFAENG